MNFASIIEMFSFIFFLLLTSSAALRAATTLFDGRYHMFSALSTNVFPYDQQNACVFEKDEKSGYSKLYLQPVFSLFPSMAVRLDEGLAEVKNCFKSGGFSYIIFSNGTNVYGRRGLYEKMQWRLPFDCRKELIIRFDHYYQRLYAALRCNDNKIHLYQLLLEGGAEYSPFIYIGQLKNNITDLMVIEDRLYMIESAHIIRKHMIALENSATIISNISDSNFHFLIYLPPIRTSLKRASRDLATEMKEEHYPPLLWVLIYSMEFMLIIVLAFLFKKRLQFALGRRRSATTNGDNPLISLSNGSFLGGN